MPKRPRRPLILRPGSPRKGQCDYCLRGPTVVVAVVGEDGEPLMVKRPVLVSRTTRRTKVCVACYRESHQQWMDWHMDHGILDLEAVR